MHCINTEHTYRFYSSRNQNVYELIHIHKRNRKRLLEFLIRISILYTLRGHLMQARITTITKIIISVKLIIRSQRRLGILCKGYMISQRPLFAKSVSIPGVTGILVTRLYGGSKNTLPILFLSTSEKQGLLRTVFDNRLYYQNNLYRTPYLMQIFHHILLTLKEKKLPELAINKKTGDEIRSGGADRNRTGVQTYSPKAFYMFIPALIVGK